MKQAIHPDYHPVVFRDRAANFAFLTRSTATSERTITWQDGNTYPVVDVEISSVSHPFYTGQARVLDTAGRVEQFRRRYGNKATGARRPQSTLASRLPVTDVPLRPLTWETRCPPPIHGGCQEFPGHQAARLRGGDRRAHAALRPADRAETIARSTAAAVHLHRAWLVSAAGPAIRS